jgi:hypothetical protein
MTPSTYKILSRFDGNKKDAIAYCLRVSIEHPQFRAEYEDYAEVIKNHVSQSFR